MRTYGVVAVVFVAATIAVAAMYRRCALRHRSPVETVTEPRVRRRSQLWTSWLADVRFPQLMSYWSPMMGVYYMPPASSPVEMWAHAQLMFVSNDNGDLMLDFLVADAQAGDTTSVPVTLHAHLLSAGQSETDLQQALAEWSATSTFVDVELRSAGDSNLVCIHQRQSFVTLELMSASGPN
jgi:hypothetical protein